MSQSFICIDLKSFYASVECSERGLDPFVTDLVVADPERSASTICLAITPAMKKKGVKNRCRIHEIPPGMQYITARPRMQLYIDYSARIYGIYLRYIAPEDIHVYSVDECFIDATGYLKLYHTGVRELAVRLMEEVLRETHITATAGIGTNMYLAKIAMDIVAKHSEEHIGILDEYSYRKLLWDHRPLTDFWQIGNGTQRKLARYGVMTMGELARFSLTSEDLLFKLFGIDAELLIDHAWGQETCRMEDIKKYRPGIRSLSNGQVLMRNYSRQEALVVLKEMADVLSMELLEKGLTTESITVAVSYDHRFERPHTGGTIRLEGRTNSSERIMEAAASVYLETTDPHTGIRRLTVCANHVLPETFLQYELFADPEKAERERRLRMALLEIRNRYGSSAVMRGTGLLSCSTFRERCGQIGGHHA